MHKQSRDELEQIAKMRRIKTYEEMSKEGLIIPLSKSKRGLDELFNNNPDNNKISEIKKNPQQIKRYTYQRIQK